MLSEGVERVRKCEAAGRIRKGLAFEVGREFPLMKRIIKSREKNFNVLVFYCYTFLFMICELLIVVYIISNVFWNRILENISIAVWFKKGD